MYVLLRYVQPMKCIGWLIRCLVLSLVLYTFNERAAWGQNPSDVAMKTEDVGMGMSMGLVQRVGDRSVILHWDPVLDARLAGYHVYRSPSATGPFRQPSVLLHTNHFVDFEVEND